MSILLSKHGPENLLREKTDSRHFPQFSIDSVVTELLDMH